LVIESAVNIIPPENIVIPLPFLFAAHPIAHKTVIFQKHNYIIFFSWLSHYGNKCICRRVNIFYCPTYYVRKHDLKIEQLFKAKAKIVEKEGNVPPKQQCMIFGRQ
jgi:hypothetical protein